MTLPLDHIGIAVQNLQESIKHYQDCFGFKVSHSEILKSQQIELAFLDLANTKIELLAPTSQQSSISKFLIDRGPGLHHICYKVEDIVAELASLKKLGARLIDEQPREGAHNTLIAFLHPKSMQGVLTELCEYRK